MRLMSFKLPASIEEWSRRSSRKCNFSTRPLRLTNNKNYILHLLLTANSTHKHSYVIEWLYEDVCLYACRRRLSILHAQCSNWWRTHDFRSAQSLPHRRLSTTASASNSSMVMGMQSCGLFWWCRPHACNVQHAACANYTNLHASMYVCSIEFYAT